MTDNTQKKYLVTIIERALAYYAVEAEDARTAAEDWGMGDLVDRDDEALESEGPTQVRERRPDGTWRRVPSTEWQTTIPPDIGLPDRQSVALGGRFQVTMLRTAYGLSLEVYPITNGEAWDDPFARFEIDESEVRELEKDLSDGE
jgi:hypothetical protein